MSAVKEPRIFLEFDTLEEAMKHRRREGTGGWIFHNAERAVICPPTLTARQVIQHPMFRGSNGALVP